MDILWFLPLCWLWLPVLALGLDLLLGDPRCLPHPVNLIGRLLDQLQKPLLRLEKHQRPGGVLALICALAVSGLIALLLLNLGNLFGFASLLGALAALYLAWSGLALGCLLREGEKARQVLLCLDKAQQALDLPCLDNIEKSEAQQTSEVQQALDEARHAVGMLVSRDVSKLDSVALYRTLAESLSENFNDAFVAPFFWLLLGGPVGLWVYKCASTADSRWGYKHEPWTHIGWAAARLDDVLAWLPARISAGLLFMSRREVRCWLGLDDESSEGGSGWPGWAVLRRDAAKMESPNAGWSMAAAAWLHGAGMGGPAVYAGKLKMKPWLGPESAQTWDARRIKNLLQHLRRAGLLGGLLLTALLALISLL
ncbi:MAG: cobalamin biosynthesis protein [Deltaproteobacteria bacterium]|jgi:adenosylcobinamide-phosphate synthase|nr:cobalamin biosynthesis protein [Deltaproteobacteria bacterium]